MGNRYDYSERGAYNQNGSLPPLLQLRSVWFKRDCVVVGSLYGCQLSLRKQKPVQRKALRSHVIACHGQWSVVLTYWLVHTLGDMTRRVADGDYADKQYPMHGE